MAVTAAAIFYLNLMCGYVPCEPRLPPPEIPPVNLNREPLFNNSANLVIRTNSGWVEGFRMRTTGGRSIAAFQGIPYAEPPLGYYRFRSAIPKVPWDGVRKARKLSDDCVQLSLTKLLRVVGNEDCLYLNIYKPDSTPQDAARVYPVLVFLQGGSYYFGGSGDLGPAYLLNQDIILVTMNFRVGILGYLSTGDDASPGNYGLKDQSLALKWIYENIATFGGDPHRITLGGHSSGAANAHMHMMSERSRRYFQSGISLSGTAFTPWAVKTRDESNRMTTQVAKYLKCSVENSRVLVNCLRRKSSNSLAASQLMLLEWIPFPVTLFGPVVEKPGPDGFLCETPEDFYFRFESEKKPWIFSMTSEEGYLGLMLMAPILGIRRLRQDWEKLAPIMMDYKYTAGAAAPQITEKLSQFYFGPNYNISKVSEEKITELFGDRMFLHGVHKAVKFHSVFAPTYAYLFDYKGKYNVANIIGIRTKDFGISHGEDLYYYFNSTQYNGFRRKDKEYELSQIMTNLITSFARSGEPFFTRPDGRVTQVWKPVNSTNIQFLILNNNHIGMIPEPYPRRIQFWSELSIPEKNALNMY